MKIGDFSYVGLPEGKWICPGNELIHQFCTTQLRVCAVDEISRRRPVVWDSHLGPAAAYLYKSFWAKSDNGATQAAQRRQLLAKRVHSEVCTGIFFQDLMGE